MTDKIKQSFVYAFKNHDSTSTVSGNDFEKILKARGWKILHNPWPYGPHYPARGKRRSEHG